MKTLKIDKGIPRPKNPRRFRYPFREMKVGDSFKVSGEHCMGLKHVQYKAMCNAQSFVRNYKRKWKFTSRIIRGGVRVWRIK